MMRDFKLLAALIALETAMNPDMSRCKPLYGKGLMLLHHALSVAGIFNPITRVLDPRTHLVLMVLVGVGWFMNEQKRCFMSLETNRACGFDNDTVFANIPHHLVGNGMTKHVMILCALVLWDIYLILSASRS